MRERLQAALKHASATGDERASSTLRLVLAAVKERDIGARQAGAADGLTDEQILTILRDMVEQRLAEIGRCERGAHLDLAEREAAEIRVLTQFLPPRMERAAIGEAVDTVIGELGVTKLKDAGRVIATLKERYNGQMDFACAKQLICQRLH